MQMSFVVSMQFIFGNDWNDACRLNTFSHWCNFPRIGALDFRVIMMQLLWCDVALHVYKYLTYQWYTRLTLRMCHGCVCTWLPRSPLAALHVHRIEIPYRAFLERVGPRILLLDSVDYFRTSNYFSARKKEQSKWGKLRGLPENEDRELRIGDWGSVKKKLEKKN